MVMFEDTVSRPKITWLDVPFHERESARDHGAFWDVRKRKWYAPRTADLSQFRRWHHSSRIYINCPYESREQAKHYGARWDPAAGSWFITDDMDIAPFEQWL